MGDVRGDFLGPPHVTTPAAVIVNKIKRFDPLEAVKHSKGDSMDYIPQFRVTVSRLWLSWMVIFEVFVGCHDILILGMVPT